MMLIQEAMANAQVGNSAQGGLAGFVPIIIIFVIFYFLLIRPQQKKIKAHNQMIDSLKKGDVVITSGGVVGKINKILDSGVVHIEIANDVVIQVMKATIGNVTDIKFETLGDGAKKTKTKAKTKTKSTK